MYQLLIRSIVFLTIEKLYSLNIVIWLNLICSEGFISLDFNALYLVQNFAFFNTHSIGKIYILFFFKIYKNNILHKFVKKKQYIGYGAFGLFQNMVCGPSEELICSLLADYSLLPHWPHLLPSAQYWSDLPTTLFRCSL